jgi:hypothetical protein
MNSMIVIIIIVVLVLIGAGISLMNQNKVTLPSEETEKNMKYPTGHLEAAFFSQGRDNGLSFRQEFKWRWLTKTRNFELDPGFSDPMGNVTGDLKIEDIMNYYGDNRDVKVELIGEFGRNRIDLEPIRSVVNKTLNQTEPVQAFMGGAKYFEGDSVDIEDQGIVLNQPDGIFFDRNGRVSGVGFGHVRITIS